jgi:hypothetical protein
MIAQPPAIAYEQPRADQSEGVEPISLKRIVASLQLVLATRRAAFTDDDKYWYTLARGM